MKETVIAVVGPTAVGKTALSVEIAKRFNGEIISGDSMQVYQGMDIGTAKITPEDMQGVPHHMIDIRKPCEAFSVADFKTAVESKIKTISNRHRIPIIAGGSGLYIQAILYDYTFPTEKRNLDITNKLEQKLNEIGSKGLHNELRTVDPIQATKIHPNNHRKIIRALEVFETTGETMSSREEKQSKAPLYNSILIGLDMEREMLYEQINKRVDKMVEEGLVQEAKSFYDAGLGNSQAMKAIGYKEFIPYFQGEQSLDDVISLLKRNSRRYAKRQYTWFKNKLPVNWYTVTPNDRSKTFQIILHNLAGILKEK
ncbi:MAG TPA: tRNA (adenosine(37)-N6)-dimethylallyltransferase MiaA [Bacillota bacterium]|nr:tRNA (adenosine(37)-N6)-dimethylallyltransferase MiaA [Bacillota bacterium]